MSLQTLVDLLIKNLDWLFSGIGTTSLAGGVAYLRKRSQSIAEGETDNHTDFNVLQSRQVLEVTPAHVENKEPYRVSLGKRHRALRENYLELNPREMATFYGFEKVSQLESCEHGDDEFSQSLIAKLVETFFVNKKHLEEGSQHIFRTFDLCSNELEHLLAQGFKPHFLCRSEKRHWLFTYPVFHKVEDGYSRTIVADPLSSFASNGGGRNNIEQIIRAMVRSSMQHYDARIVKVDTETWCALRHNTFYSKNMLFGIGAADDECCDIFEEWYKAIVKRYHD